MSTGNNLTYFNWAPGEPNNNGNGEFCIEMNQNQGLWNDYNCFVKLYFMCEERR